MASCRNEKVSQLDYGWYCYHIAGLVYPYPIAQTFMVKPKVKKSVAKAAGKKTLQKLSQMSGTQSKEDPATTAQTGDLAQGDRASDANLDGNGVSKQPGAGQSQPRQPLEPIKSQSGADLTEKIKELLRLAQEQGYLTYNDVNDALPSHMIMPDEFDEILIKLRNLEVEIVDQAEVDRVKQPEHEEEEEKTRLDILDDPVRMYLKQMGQVPLLTREQEVEISKRIEGAENELKRIIYSFGFAGKEHIALAEKLISEPPKERFDRVVVDKKIEGRDNHLRHLRKLVKTVRELDQQVDQKYAEWGNGATKAKRDKLASDFKKLDRKLQDSFSKFYFKQKVIEEMTLVAENIHDKIQLSIRTMQESESQRKGGPPSAAAAAEQRKIKALEEFVRMPFANYLKAYSQLKH